MRNSIANPCGCFLSTSPRSLSDEPSVKPSSIEGAWKLVARRGSDKQDYQPLPAGVEMIKYMTAGRYVWTIVKDGRIIAAAFVSIDLSRPVALLFIAGSQYR